MRYYQFESKNDYLLEKKRLCHSEELVRGCIDTLARIYATGLKIEAEIETYRLIFIFDRDFYFSTLTKAFRRRGVNKDHEGYKAPPFDTRILDKEITVKEEEFKEWLQETHTEFTQSY